VLCCIAKCLKWDFVKILRKMASLPQFAGIHAQNQGKFSSKSRHGRAVAKKEGARRAIPFLP
jgi:hypothetical protein